MAHWIEESGRPSKGLCEAIGKEFGLGIGVRPIELEEDDVA
jgi:hypothetical protein